MPGGHRRRHLPVPARLLSWKSFPFRLKFAPTAEGAGGLTHCCWNRKSAGLCRQCMDCAMTEALAGAMWTSGLVHKPTPPEDSQPTYACMQANRY